MSDINDNRLVSGNTLPAISISEASALTEKIRYAAHDVKSSILGLSSDVSKFTDALDATREAKAHLTLGFSDWDDYVVDSLSGVFSDLKYEKRKELISTLYGHGLSVRKIAKALDMGKSTVHNELSNSRTPSLSEDSHQLSDIDSVASAIARGEKPPPSSKPKPKPKAKRRSSYPPAEPVTTSVTSLQGRQEQSLRAAAEAIATLSTDSTYVARRGDVLAGLLEELKLQVDSALTQLDSVE